MGAGLAVVVALWSLSGGEEPGLRVAPAELIGRWTTPDPRYAGRAMTFEESFFTLDAGAGVVARHAIVSIRVDSVPVHREYSITYEGASGREIVEVFVYDDETLRLKNPSEATWRRAPSR